MASLPLALDDLVPALSGRIQKKIFKKSETLIHRKQPVNGQFYSKLKSSSWVYIYFNFCFFFLNLSGTLWCSYLWPVDGAVYSYYMFGAFYTLYKLVPVPVLWMPELVIYNCPGHTFP